ncbi:unnamed protein product [Closterium sp. NIES-54]
MVTTTTLGGRRVSICTYTRTGRHLATFTRWPGSSLYTLATEPPQVAAPAQVSASGPVAPLCSCRLLSHETLLWHHRLGHPSLPCLRGMHSRLLVCGLPRSLPPLPPSPSPPCLPCVEGWQRTAPHSSFPQRLLPCRLSAWTCEAQPASVDRAASATFCWLLTTTRVCLQLRERFRKDLRVLRLHSDRGGEFSSYLLRDFCCVEGILQSFTLPESPQQNGIAERRIGLVMEVARTSMIHAAAPHFRWPFAVRYRRTLTPHVLEDRQEDFECLAAVVPHFASMLLAPEGDLDAPDIPTPCSYVEAITGPYFSQLQAAMDAEMASWKTIGIYVDEVPPSRANIVDGMWIFRVKQAQGSPPAFNTFSPTPKMTTLRVLLHVAAQRDYELHSLDFSTAFLQGSLHEEIWLRRPPGFTGSFPTGAQWSLRRPVYGLRQAPHKWHDSLRTTLAALGFAPSTADPSLFLRTDTSLPPFYSMIVHRQQGHDSLVSGAHTGAQNEAHRSAILPCSRVAAVWPASSCTPDPESDRARAVSPTVSRLLATAVSDPSFESTAVSALVAELLYFAAACRLDYTTALVCPPSVGGDCALGTDVLEDRKEDFECLTAAVPHFASMLLAPEGDPDAPDIPTPHSYTEAITGPYSSQWQAAMDAEMASWKSTGTYVDEVPPPGANIVDGMWIFRVKRALGSRPAFKACYVARGFSQRSGVDYFQTFSPTPKMTTLWVLLHVAAQRDYKLHSLDFSTAFLQCSLHEEIWLRRPPGFTGSFPTALGFAPSSADPSMFLRTDTSLPLFYVLVYVDDLVFATADTKALTLVKLELKKRHTYTDPGELRSYLGLQITRDRARRTITLTESHMVHQVLQRFGYQFSSPQPTPLSTSHSLSAPPSDDCGEPSDPYPELVGCLMYLIICTRPDLAYPLSLLARYIAPGRHRKVHWDASKRVLHYLCSTSGMGLVLGGRGPVVLTGHADASWVDE